MNDFRLIVFLSVAKFKSFTKAAHELRISQPAISQHIKELESSYNVRLFERAQNTIALTYQGEIFLTYAMEITQKYKELEFEINLLNNQSIGKLVIGASTTISQYVLPAIMARYMKRFPNIELSLISGNSDQIELMVYRHEVDFGIIEGYGHRKEFNYSFFAKDELVLITSAKNKVKQELSVEEFEKLPLILRENGSGTLAVMENTFNNYNIQLSDLNIKMQLGSSESIKRFVEIENNYAVISIAAIMDELAQGRLKVLDIDNITMPRDFSFITLAGFHNKLAEEFFQFAVLTHKEML